MNEIICQENGTWDGTWWSIDYGVSGDEWGDVRRRVESNRIVECGMTDIVDFITSMKRKRDVL